MVPGAVRLRDGVLVAAVLRRAWLDRQLVGVVAGCSVRPDEDGPVVRKLTDHVQRRRITAALIGLVLLLLGGWLVQNVVAEMASPTPPRLRVRRVPGRQVGHECQSGGADSGLAVKPLSSCRRKRPALEVIQAGARTRIRTTTTWFRQSEKLLPLRATVHKSSPSRPRSTDRGAGGLITVKPGTFYTGDHYVSFVVVDPGK